MPVPQSSHLLKVTKSRGGRLRVDIPATSIEAENLEELVGKLENRLAEFDVALKALADEMQLTMMREIEKKTPRGAALDQLAEEYPAPPSWYNEPEWTDHTSE